MLNASSSPANQQRSQRLEHLLREMLAEVQQRGFYGRAELVLTVQDGTIQHIVRRIERQER